MTSKLYIFPNDEDEKLQFILMSEECFLADRSACSDK